MNEHVNGQKGFVGLIFALGIIVLLGIVGHFLLLKETRPTTQQTQSTQKKIETQNTKSKELPIQSDPLSIPVEATGRKIVFLTSPKNGATFSQSTQIRITGKTKPNFYIHVYGNYSEKDLQCLTYNFFSNGGADQADANGNFDFPIAYEGYRKGQNTLAVAALPATNIRTCFSTDNVSSMVTYTYTGPVPNY